MITAGMLPLKIEKRVELDRPFASSELRPREEGQTEVDGGRIERIDGVAQIYSKGVVDVEFPRPCDEDLGEILVNTPIPNLVGVCKRIPGHPSPYSHVVELRFGCTETGLDVPQAFSIGELGKGHGKILVPTGEGLDLVLAAVPLHALMEFVCGQKIHKLGKHRLPLWAASQTPAKSANYRPSKTASQ